MGKTEASVLAGLYDGMIRLRKGSEGVADRVPVFAQMSHHSARLLGESSNKFFSNAETFLRCELSADIFYEIDAPTIHYDVYNIEAEALGARLIWGERQVPAIDPRHPLLGSVDACESLHPPKMGAAGRMSYVLEINSRLADLGLLPKIRFTGLFTLAANLLGLEALIVAILSKPARVHRLMKFLTYEVVAPWIACQREHCGRNETATGSEALASPPLVSIAMVREFCLAYIKELEKQVGGIRLAGLWGESFLREPKELLDLKKEGSPASIQVLDPDVTALAPAFFRKYADEVGVALVMGLDANLVGSGPISKITARTRRFIEEAGRAGRFILFINDIPYDTPPKNVRAVMAVAHEYQSDGSHSCYLRQRGAVTNTLERPIEDIHVLISKLTGRYKSRVGL